MAEVELEIGGFNGRNPGLVGIRNRDLNRGGNGAGLRINRKIAYFPRELRVAETESGGCDLLRRTGAHPPELVVLGGAVEKRGHVRDTGKVATRFEGRRRKLKEHFAIRGVEQRKRVVVRQL